jgi:hypothetical protein
LPSASRITRKPGNWCSVQPQPTRLDNTADSHTLFEDDGLRLGVSIMEALSTNSSEPALVSATVRVGTILAAESGR